MFLFISKGLSETLHQISSIVGSPASTQLLRKISDFITSWKANDLDQDTVGCAMVLNSPLHYGTKRGHFETSKIHFPKSEGVSEVSERANKSGASEQVSGASK